MQLRCTYCQTMFALSRDELLAALEHATSEKLQYYPAHCPKCRRANRVERTRMERFFPGWKDALKVMAKQAASVEQGQAPAQPTASEKAGAKAEKPAAKPKPAPAKKAPAKAEKPAAKAEKPAAKKTSTPGKSAATEASPHAKKTSTKTKTPPQGKKK